MTPRRPAFRHVAIAEQLMARIDDGTFPIGSQLPTEMDLCASLGASRHTVRQALQALTERGLIIRRPGAGSMVIAQHQPSIYVQAADSMTHSLSGRSDVTRRIVETGHVQADAEQAMLLQCRPKDPWFRLRSVYYTRGGKESLSTADIYILPAYAGITAHRKHSSMRISDQVVDMFNEEIDRVQVEIFAGPASASQAERLGIATGDPTMTVIRRYIGLHNRVFEVSATVYPQERHVYLIELRRHFPPSWSAGKL